MRNLLTALGLLSLIGCTTDPQMVRIAPGRFIAGSASAETDAVHYPDVNAAREQPSRNVIVEKAFAIGRTEVTRGQFARFARATGWQPDGPCSYLAPVAGSKWTPDGAHDWRHPGYAQTDAHPVVCVSLTDAQAYAAWLSARTHRHFRLPTNTEWEYAARAGTTGPQFWDNTANPCQYGNLADLTYIARYQIAETAQLFTCRDGFAATAPVGSFKPNPWGLYDMLGNVWEWTLDCLNDNQRNAPANTAARTTGDCRSHIDRGASWANSRKYVRAAAQHPDLVGARTSVLGFRLVEDLP